jgi:thiosulfate dehydrogenase [quinone] large subunit
MAGDDDRALARALLRLTMGINLIVHGLVRVPRLSEFAGGMAREFAPTILPTGLVHAFGLLLPFVEVLVGGLVVVGLFQRAALVLGALSMAALVLGTALLQHWDILTQQIVYAFIYAALLATRSWDRWSLDSIRGSGSPR